MILAHELSTTEKTMFKTKENIMNDGKYTISNHDYHANKTHYSSSTLKEALPSPAHFKYNILQGNKKPLAESTALLLGTLVHTVILEPELFDAEYVVHEGETNKDGSVPAKFVKLHNSIEGETRKLISLEHYEFAMKARLNTAAYSEASKLLFSPTGESEPSYFTTCKETGLKLKVRPDRIDLTNKFIVDTKTAIAIDKYEFSKAIRYDRHYDLSAYMYVKQVYEATGVLCDYYWHVIGKEEMCPIAIYKMSQATLDSGKSKFFKACDNIKAALAMPDTIQYQNEIEEI